MTYTVTLQQLSAQPIAVVRRRAPQSALSQVVPDACGEVWRFIRANNIAGAGRHVAIYYDRAINLEVGVEVPGSFIGSGEVYRSALPAGLAAHAAHIGPYHLLGGAHTAIGDWCRSNNRLPSGPSWEVYGHWTDDPAKLRTDVFYLLKS